MGKNKIKNVFVEHKKKLIFTISILILIAFFLLIIKINQDQYYDLTPLGMGKIEKSTLQSLYEVAKKDGLGRMSLCSISNGRCVLVGKIENG